MRQQHHPLDSKTYQKGINSDTNNEILGSSQEGEHLDALNMRSMPMDGNNMAKKKIKGEEILFPLIDNRCNPVGTITFTAYQCMMAQEVNGHIVEVWASSDVDEHPIIRVDGIIVAYSKDLPFRLRFPLQYDKNESCVGGEVYITNNNTPPLVFNVKDLLDNSTVDCTEKYFSEFQLEAYEIQVSAILYKPAFIKQDPSSSGYDYVIGGTGLPVGSYSYAYRFVDDQGEFTEWSPITELIPVVRNNSPANGPQYPHSRTFSSEPNIASPTSYGNHLRVRYQNDNLFAYIELRRDSWYAGDPIGTPPVSQVIASIPVSTGMNVINIMDKADANFDGAVELDAAEQSNTGSNVSRAKSIRYFNSRLYLMNVSYESKDIEDKIRFVDDTASGVFSTIENMGTPSHKHVYNSAMYKSNMRGEKTGFGIVLFDKSNNPTYALPIPEASNFEFPNRRDTASADTIDTSYKGLVYAADTDGKITYTHEVFDHYDAVSKTGQSDDRDDVGLMYNYRDNALLLPNWWEYTKAQMNPVSQFDTKSKLNLAVNSMSALDSGNTWVNYAPKGFGLNYYAQGFGFKGIDLWPKWADGFSVVQTEPAKRVVAQGLGFYALTPADGVFGSDTQKETNAFWSYFPDLDVLNPEIAEDLVNNPNSYSIQLVSPLGYFSEVYNTDKGELDNRRKGADIITYARILRDANPLAISPEPEINPGLGKYSGIDDPTDPNFTYKYVAYGRYTNDATGDSPAFPLNGDGNKTFPIREAEDLTVNSTRQTYFRISVDDIATGAIYNTSGMTSATNTTNNADAPGVREWREPMYVINLVKNNDISQGVTTEYKYGSSYVKFKSLVLESSGAASQSAVLVSERWEDCIPQVDGQVNNAYNSLKRFVYVENSNGITQRWMNIQFESGANQTTILNGLAAAAPAPYNDPVLTNGFDIYGVYTSSEDAGDGDGVCRIFTLNFNEIPGYSLFSVVPKDRKVYVTYDPRIPVRVFGGDTYINESIWAAIDNNYANNGEPSETEGGWKYPSNRFDMNAPFPLKAYDFVDTYPTWQRSGGGAGWNYDFGIHFQFCDSAKANSAWMRQLITMWTAETRVNLSFAFNVEQPDKAVSDQYYPLINYIPRPYKWDLSDPNDRVQFQDDNNLIPDYYNDYGFEWNLWNNGGFRFLMNDLQTNIDYSKSQTNKSFFTKPSVGFQEQLDFCTRIIWSLKRPMNAQSSPSVKTFPVANYFDISDDTGEIKFAWSAMSGDKGNNLYAFTDSGICLLVVDKRVIHEINANELATIGSDVGGILNQLWIDRTIGMHDETWRSWAEYSNAIFFANGISAYAFSDNQLTEIARTGFFELLNRKFNQLIGNGYDAKMSGGFNVLNKEYIMNVNNGDEFSTLIYGINQNSLQCQSSYDYDKYLYFKNHLFGMKGSGTYELGIGNQIDGQDIPAYLTGVSDAQIISDKEFIRIRVNSNSKPEQIYFYKSFDDYKTDTYDSVVDANAVPLSIKNYFGYECYIPRSIYAPYERNQGRMVIFKIVRSADEDFLVTSTAVQFKALK